MYTWVDLGLAVVWVLLNYWFVFASPFYKWLGGKKQYAFTREEVMRGRVYMARVGVEPPGE